MYFFGSPFSMHVCHVQNHVARSVVSTVHGLTLLLALAAISTMAIGLGPASQGYPVVNGGSDLERLGYSYSLFFMGSERFGATKSFPTSLQFSSRILLSVLGNI